MDVIEKARELGVVLQEDERYKRYIKAVMDNDTDTQIQNSIGEFNQLRAELSVQMKKPDKDADVITQLDEKIKTLYDQIMAMPKMVEFNEAKDEMDKLINSINYIVSMAANGEDPKTCPAVAPHTCGGSCESCGGCG